MDLKRLSLVLSFGAALLAVGTQAPVAIGLAAGLAVVTLATSLVGMLMGGRR